MQEYLEILGISPDEDIYKVAHRHIPVELLAKLCRTYLESPPTLKPIYTSPVREVWGAPPSYRYLRNIWVEDGYLYLTEGTANKLSIWSVHKPSSPALISELTTPPLDTGPLDIIKRGRYLYISSGDSVCIVDVANPSSPSVISSITDPTKLGHAHGIALLGRYLYVTGYTNGYFNVVDTSNPQNPSIVGSISGIGGAHDVVVDYPYAYISHSGALTIVDISNPYAPSIVSSLAISPNYAGIAKKGNYVFTGNPVGGATGYLHCSDVKNPTAPSLVSSLPIGAYWIVSAGDYLFCCGNAHGGDCISIVDISDPQNMKVIFQTQRLPEYYYFMNCFLDGKYLYATIAEEDVGAMFRVYEIENILKLTGLRVGDRVFPYKKVGPYPVLITSGLYTGNSTPTRAVAHGLEGPPDIVLIGAEHSLRPHIFMISRTWDRIWCQYGTGSSAYIVAPPDATNFYVGNSANYEYSANLSGDNYYWVAIRGM